MLARSTGASALFRGGAALHEGARSCAGGEWANITTHRTACRAAILKLTAGTSMGRHSNVLENRRQGSCGRY